MLSERAKKYLASLVREPVEVDEVAIAAALDAAGVPVFPAVVRFQIDYGGYVEWYGYNDFHWGILHHEPEPNSYFEPNQIHFECEDEYRITCANCHGSDHWTLNSKGELYWCGGFKATSFEKKIERDAFVRELSKYGKTTRIKFDAPGEEIIEILIPRLQDGIVAEASDEHHALYFKDNLYLAVNFDRDSIIAYTVGDETPKVIKDISFELSS